MSIRKPTRAQACIGKKRFATIRAAEKELNRRVRSGASAYRLHFYRCSYCHGYHIGSKLGIKRKK